MSATNELDLSAGMGKSRLPVGRARQRWWNVVAVALLAAVFGEAVLAGAMLSGAGWARPAHGLTAAVLLAATFAAGLLALITLRAAVHGRRFALTLLGLAASLLVQAALGVLTARGANLLWLHVPIGVALVGFAAQAVAVARRLGER
jgi:hypothetical protein